MRLLVTALALLAASPTFAATPALHEVNAARAQRGLPAFAEDASLTAAAMRAADYRAANRIAGHVSGNLGDFGFLPAGAHADAAGCGALEPSWGWGTCCTYDSYQYAGAAVTRGADGRRYMHLFVSHRPNAATAPACVCGDGCTCPAGACPACPTAFTVADAPDAYAAAYARVAAGETVTLSVGVPAVPGGVRVASVPGVKPGVYACRLVKGVNTMSPVVPVTLGDCASGKCASPFGASR